MDKSKYLLPYKKVRYAIDDMLNLDRYIRFFLSGDPPDEITHGHIIQVKHNFEYKITCNQNRYKTLQEAMDNLDASLIAKGYVILTDEQLLLI